MNEIKRENEMARAQFKIDNEQDSVFATDWIRNQLQGIDFPYEDWEPKQKAFDEFHDIHFRDFEKTNAWCEKHLKKVDWKKLKGAIRSKRLRKKRVFGEASIVIRVDMETRAHSILKTLAKHHGVTLSKAIEIYMEKAWLDLPLEDEKDDPTIDMFEN